MGWGLCNLSRCRAHDPVEARWQETACAQMLRKIRAWARQHTSKRRYSPVGVVFHWGMAVIVVAMFWLGWSMGRLDAGSAKLGAFHLHMIVGLLTLLLAVMRLLWRILIPGPVNDADDLGIQTLLAQLTHVAFYVCLVGLPLSGWLAWSAFAGDERLGLGLFRVPPFPFEFLEFEQKRLILYWADAIHHFLIWTLLIIIPVHAGAALKHHFWDRHDVLVGMLPVLPNDERPKASTRKRKASQSQSSSKPDL